MSRGGCTFISVTCDDILWIALFSISFKFFFRFLRTFSTKNRQRSRDDTVTSTENRLGFLKENTAKDCFQALIQALFVPNCCNKRKSINPINDSWFDNSDGWLLLNYREQISYLVFLFSALVALDLDDDLSVRQMFASLQNRVTNLFQIKPWPSCAVMKWSCREQDCGWNGALRVPVVKRCTKLHYWVPPLLFFYRKINNYEEVV